MNITKNIEIKYDGTEGYIDINTFLTSQFHILGIINELQQELFPDREISIKIKAFSKGSFSVELVFMTGLMSYLFNKEAADIFIRMLGTFADLISIGSLLKGKKADDVQVRGDQVVINVTGDNNTITVNKESYRIYQTNQSVNTAMRKNFELLDNDEAVSGVQITDIDTSEVLIDIPRDDFTGLTCGNEYFDKHVESDTRPAVLYIKKPDHFPKNVARWSFFYDGAPITAVIKDQEFIAQINAGEKFGQGDALQVELKTEYVWDDRFNTKIRNGKYEVLSVSGIIRRPEQKSLFDAE